MTPRLTEVRAPKTGCPRPPPPQCLGSAATGRCRGIADQSEGGPASISSTRPQTRAVWTSIAVPERANHAVRAVLDAAGEADGAALAGDEAHGDLRKAEGGGGGGDHPVADGGQLRSGTDAVAVDPGGEPVGHGRQRSGGKSLHADRMSRRRVGGRAELPEIPTAAEGWAVPLERGGQSRVGRDQCEGLHEGVPHRHVHGVVALGALEGDRELVTRTLQPDRVERRHWCGQAPLGQPGGELRAGLEVGVDQ